VTEGLLVTEMAAELWTTAGLWMAAELWMAAGPETTNEAADCVAMVEPASSARGVAMSAPTGNGAAMAPAAAA
jgi:hypothetical protein